MVCEWFGLGAQSIIALFEGQLWTFAGMGSLLLTVGPAYSEYKEATKVRNDANEASQTA
jgi:hypothetical protein